MSTRAELSTACLQVAAFYLSQHNNPRRREALNEDPNRHKKRADLVSLAGLLLSGHSSAEHLSHAVKSAVAEAVQHSAFDLLMLEGHPGYTEWGHKMDEASLLLHELPVSETQRADLYNSGPLRLRRTMEWPLPNPMDEVRAARMPRGGQRVPPPPPLPQSVPRPPHAEPLGETPVPYSHEAEEVRDEEEI